VDAALAGQLDLYCPECGYDLRSIESDRCPECGWTIDRAVASASRIPWTHRRTIGRWRAYWRTAWRGKVSQIAVEAVRPVDAADARRFAHIVLLAITVPIAVMVLAACIATGGTNLLNPLTDDALNNAADNIWGAADVLVPLSAGMTLWGVVPLCIVLLSFLLPIGTRVWFGGGADDSMRARAAALSYYSFAPLAYVAIALALGLIAYPFQLAYERSGDMAMLMVQGTLVVTAWLLTLVCLVAFYFNTLRLLQATTQAPALKVLGVAIALPLSWILCAVVALVIAPWLIGLLYLMIDSLLP
jgi:hypothetical protein